MEQITYPFFQAFDACGHYLVGGKLYAYRSGTDTPVNLYSDAGKTVKHPWPVVLDARGEAKIYAKGRIKLVLKDALGNVINTIDPVTSEDSSIYLSPEQYNAVGDGVADDSEAFADMFGDLTGTGAIIQFQPGKIYLTDPVTIPQTLSNTIIDGNGATWKCTATGFTGILLQAETDDYRNLTYYPMAHDYTVGDQEVELSSGISHFVADDWIYVRSSNGIAELNKVRSINSNTITLYWPLSKKYTNDSITTHGVANANTIIIENLTFRNIIFDTAVRPAQLNNLYNCTFENCWVRSDGGIMMRGRGLRWFNNRFDIIPSWNFADLTRPYYYGADTGSCDIVATGNQCYSKGIGIVHIHEGCANVNNGDNIYLQSATDSGIPADVTFSGARWAVLSNQGYGWNIKHHHNTIINSPADGIMFVLGVENSEADSNTLVGSFGRYGLRDYGNTSLSLINNDLRATTCTSDYISSYSADTVLSLNKVPDGVSYHIDTWHPGIDQNIGLGDATYISLSGETFLAQQGSPELVDFRGVSYRNKAWAMDKATVEEVSRMWIVPSGVKKIIPEIYWTNGGAGAGNVSWTVLMSAFDDGDDMNTSDILGWVANIAAPAQNILAVDGASSSVISVTPGQLVGLRVFRIGTDSADTLDNDALFIGLGIKSVP